MSETGIEDVCGVFSAAVHYLNLRGELDAIISSSTVPLDSYYLFACDSSSSQASESHSASQKLDIVDSQDQTEQYNPNISESSGNIGVTAAKLTGSANSELVQTSATAPSTMEETNTHDDSLLEAMEKNTTYRGSVRVAGKSWETCDAEPRPFLRSLKLFRILESPGRSYDEAALRKFAWTGIPSRFRSFLWPMLIGYMPFAKDRQQSALQRRRQEYQQNVTASRSAGAAEADQTLLRQILVDVPRTAPLVPLIQAQWVQRSLERVLFAYASRHPATGYVQGLNDLATPFYAVFLSPWVDSSDSEIKGASDDDLQGVEADVYWCLCRLLEGISDHYTAGQAGIQRMIHTMRTIVLRLDPHLVHILESNEVEFQDFAFRWMNCLLLREIPFHLVFRIWDTYIAESKTSVIDGFQTFHVYVCATLLLKYSEQLKKMGHGDMFIFLQKLPTQEWTLKDVEELLAQSYVNKSLFSASSVRH